jgi:hypothetical protein
VPPVIVPSAPPANMPPVNAPLVRVPDGPR